MVSWRFARRGDGRIPWGRAARGRRAPFDRAVVPKLCRRRRLLRSGFGSSTFAGERRDTSTVVRAAPRWQGGRRDRRWTGPLHLRGHALVRRARRPGGRATAGGGVAARRGSGAGARDRGEPF